MSDKAEPEQLDRTYPVREHMRVQQRLWAVERAGAPILSGIVLLTLLGAFSNGLLSTASKASADDALRVEYERFLRNGATTTLLIESRKRPGAPHRIDIAGELLAGLTLESVQPQPLQSATLDGRGLSLRMAPDAEGRVQLQLALRADGTGAYRSRIEVDGQGLNIFQFIYP